MEDFVVLTLMKSTAVVMGRIISHCLSLQHCFFLCVFSSSSFISFKWKPFSPRHCSQVIRSWWPCSHPVQFSFGNVTISFFCSYPSCIWTSHTSCTILSGKQPPHWRTQNHCYHLSVHARHWTTCFILLVGRDFTAKNLQTNMPALPRVSHTKIYSVREQQEWGCSIKRDKPGVKGDQSSGHALMSH